MLDFSNFEGDKSFFPFFEEISKIPRGSGNCEGIANYLSDFAAKRGLFSYRDGYNNVIIKKAATPGYENAPTVILQAHTDMVIAKAPDYKGSIEKDGVSLYIDGDFIRADGTTLGADNGLGMSYMLSILDSDTASHPAIEAVFTADEEIGLIGAGGLDTSVLSGKTMINLDTDSEGFFITGCAGGIRVDMIATLKTEAAHGCSKIKISGLLGGHSGGCINMGRVNAIKLLSEIIPDGARIGSIRGGTVENAIPTFAECIIADANELDTRVKEALSKYGENEKNISIEIESVDGECELFTRESTAKILELIKREHYGPIAMSEDFPSLVETSMNLGVISSAGSEFSLYASIRSSEEKKKAEALEKAKKIAEELGFAVTTQGDYPGWAYKKISPLRDKLCEKFYELFGREAKTIIIHAGLECGIFAGKISDLDCVSMGPTAYDLHTTAERLSISSAIKIWGLILKTLENFKGEQI